MTLRLSTFYMTCSHHWHLVLKGTLWQVLPVGQHMLTLSGTRIYLIHSYNFHHHFTFYALWSLFRYIFETDTLFSDTDVVKFLLTTPAHIFRTMYVYHINTTKQHIQYGMTSKSNLVFQPSPSRSWDDQYPNLTLMRIWITNLVHVGFISSWLNPKVHLKGEWGFLILLKNCLEN